MEKTKILFLAANPSATRLLELDEEILQITAKLRAAEHRDAVELLSRQAVRPDDVLQALQEVKPHIVHFSGHGSPAAELILLDGQGSPKPVSRKALIQLFGALKDGIGLVVLNFCDSLLQAEAIAGIVGCAIGMSEPIGDKA